jgi:hypothetical protein
MHISIYVYVHTYVHIYEYIGIQLSMIPSRPAENIDRYVFI